jgi:hypothetical protein
MRSRNEYIITKQEIHGVAELWLQQALKLEYEGYKCTTHILLQILLIAASRTCSVLAACRGLADAPCDQTIRNALEDTLPRQKRELEKRLNAALITELPKALRRRSRPVALDLTLIPYHGQPMESEKEIYRGQAKSGTTHFHAYATAVVVHKGFRYAIALTSVEKGEKMPAVLKRVLEVVRRIGLKVRYLLLDKAFYSVAVIKYLNAEKLNFIIPAALRGRKAKNPKTPPTGLRAILKKPDGRYRYTMTQGRTTTSVEVQICVASKGYVYDKTGKRRRKRQLYAVRNVSGSPRKIWETYRRRFGIETSYRQMNEARIKTCTRDPLQRLLFVGIALVLRNIWVWLHFRFAKEKHSEEPQVFLVLLRFREMLNWIMQIIQRNLGADKIEGLDVETYARLRGEC